MEIKILGTGCSRCDSLEKEVYNALAELDVAASVLKIKDIHKIMAYNVLATPGLVINEKIKVSGRLPRREEIRRYIQEELDG